MNDGLVALQRIVMKITKKDKVMIKQGLKEISEGKVVPLSQLEKK